MHSEISVSSASRRRWSGDGCARRAKEGAGQGDSGSATGIREKPRLPDADKAAWQDVLDEAAQKLHGGERHRAPMVVMGVVLPLKCDVVPVEREESMIADRHAMGIPPEVAEHSGRATEGWLRVDDSVRLEERVDEGVPLGRVAQMLEGAGEIEFVSGVRAPEGGHKLSAEDPTEHLDRQKEAGVFESDPGLVIG